jgi:hypothetical protein
MDHPAALHRLTVGVPATVEHSSEATEGGSEIAKWVAETTSVNSLFQFKVVRLTNIVIHYIYGCFEVKLKG